MKILKAGVVKPDPRPVWIGLQLECPKCDTLFELEEGDPVHAVYEQSRVDKYDMVAACPTCKHQVFSVQYLP